MIFPRLRARTQIKHIGNIGIVNIHRTFAKYSPKVSTVSISLYRKSHGSARAGHKVQFYNFVEGQWRRYC